MLLPTPEEEGPAVLADEEEEEAETGQEEERGTPVLTEVTDNKERKKEKRR